MLATLLVGAVAVGALTVVATALPKLPGLERFVAVAGSALIIFGVLLLGARLLLVRHAPFRALWPGAVMGAVVVALVINLGTPLLTRLVAKAGPVYGSFATVAGIFALLYLVSQALVYSAEVAAVRYGRLWPRALDVNDPAPADFRAYALLARQQERIQVTRVDLRVVPPDSPEATSDAPPASRDSPPASSDAPRPPRDTPPASRESPPAASDSSTAPRDSPAADGGPPRSRPP
jgi:hypothetical protein